MQGCEWEIEVLVWNLVLFPHLIPFPFIPSFLFPLFIFPPFFPFPSLVSFPTPSSPLQIQLETATESGETPGTHVADRFRVHSKLETKLLVLALRHIAVWNLAEKKGRYRIPSQNIPLPHPNTDNSDVCHLPCKTVASQSTRSGGGWRLIWHPVQISWLSYLLKVA